MPESETKMPMGCPELDKFGHGQLMFEFFEEVKESSGRSCGFFSVSFDGRGSADDEEEEEEENECKAEAAKAFWDSQEKLVLATLRRTTSLESKIRQATKDALEELHSIGVNCVCHGRAAEGCSKCTRNEVYQRLQNAGFNCSICKSKWSSSSEIPAGEHSYMEVVQRSKKGDVKVIIELNFRSEFVIARACDGYKRLINRLPEVFVGKLERLKNLIQILCSASKKCMKQKKMHVAPWRKQQYMEAKWLGKPELKSQPPPAAIFPASVHFWRPRRSKASLLTFDLLDNLPGLHHATMIKVV